MINKYVTNKNVRSLKKILNSVLEKITEKKFYKVLFPVKEFWQITLLSDPMVVPKLNVKFAFPAIVLDTIFRFRKPQNLHISSENSRSII